MFCDRCGTQLAEGAVFCEQCGKKVAGVQEVIKPVAEQVKETDVYEVPYVAENPPEAVEYREYASETDYRRPIERPEYRMYEAVVDVVKRVGGSPLFLIGVIAFTIQLIASIIPTRSVWLDIITPVLKYMNMADVSIPYEALYVIEVLDSYGWGVRLLINVLTNIPAMIVCIGLWVAFSSAKSRRSSGMKTGGLTTIKAVNIYQIVVTSISFAVAEAFLIIGMIASGDLYSAYDGYLSSGASVAIWILGGIAALLAVVFIFMILYYSKVIKSISNVKKAIATDSTEYRASVYVAVWLIIGAVCSIAAIFTNFVSAVATIVYLICFSSAIFGYNSGVNRLALKREGIMR